MGTEPLEPVAKLSATPTLGNRPNGDQKTISTPVRTWHDHFQIPLHYPRLPIFGDVEQKRDYAMGAFLWPC
ncbi:hypothetical protein V6N13_068815 [Hibiscus sabdariffa]